MSKAKGQNHLKVKAVLFDLDETLIDSIQGHVGAHAEVCRILIEFLKERGISADKRDLLSKIEKLDDEMNRRFIYDRDEWWPRLMQEVSPQIKLPRELVKELTRKYWLAYASSAKLYPDTIHVLEYLKKKGYRLGLVSDTDGLPGMKRHRIGIQPFRDLFDVTLVSGEETKESKPSPEPFLIAAERLGVKPEESIFVGDKPFADVEGAKNAGMKTVHIHRRDWQSHVKADYVIRSLDELKQIL